MSYTVYYWPTPNAHKVTMFLEEAQIDYRVKAVDITKGEQFDTKFLQISPNNRIPAITLDDASNDEPQAIFESGAILQYLAERHRMFLPNRSKERCQVLQWLFWQVGGLGPMAGQNHHFANYASEKIPYAINRYVAETKRLHKVLDTQLEKNQFIAGDQLSIADFATYPWVVPWQRQGQDIETTPHLKRWLEEIEQRAATKRAYAIADSFHHPSELTESARRILFQQSEGTS